MNRIFSYVFLLALCHNTYGQDTTSCRFLVDSTNGINYVLLPDIEPEFPGGETEMMSFIMSNFEYPVTPACGSGTVYVSFFIMSNGLVSNIQVERTIDKAFGEAAIQVIEKMPNWTPGKCGQTAVNVKYTIPIIINYK